MSSRCDGLGKEDKYGDQRRGASATPSFCSPWHPQAGIPCQPGQANEGQLSQLLMMHRKGTSCTLHLVKTALGAPSSDDSVASPQPAASRTSTTRSGERFKTPRSPKVCAKVRQPLPGGRVGAVPNSSRESTYRLIQCPKSETLQISLPRLDDDDTMCRSNVHHARTQSPTLTRHLPHSDASQGDSYGEDNPFETPSFSNRP